MKNGYYLYVENCGSPGVLNKIAMQIATFKKFFNIEPIQIKSTECSAVRRLYNLMPWASFEREYDDAIRKMSSPDFVYIRRTYIERAYLHFLEDIHDKWPNCKIIVEQPVYPYKKDMLNSAYTRLFYFKEILYRDHYKDNIDRFVTYSDDDEILGVPTIRTMNGVNVDNIVPVDQSIDYNPNNIKLLTVATLIPHHGYERVFKGLANYYRNGGKRHIELRMVGDGPEKAKYISMVRNLGLEDNVIFYGAKYGEELNEMYADADAGMSAFGAYKEGVDKLCTIKAREYVAKGLPVISGCEDNLFLNEAKEFGLIYSNDDSDVDIDRLVKYLDNLYAEDGRPATVKRIRDLAYRTVDNSVTLQPVIEYIEGQ